ncbi:uncharacterized protein LOC121977283 [Zingiber officinale]|uniref:Zinc-ribbon domain-containing protein n=1 Tax=Zingiber officinale TaxID=94328 RepID=A0A8J5L855_ZINOF|nr:uncharacterized protein LOC121977283 [Zingiber officinale]XP_042385805.1 uncharacterized protein LOC121977283 [Zingiber officinale]KAG6509384.1 hypothetical protein ZIOFF_027371 [Zingiber officinale]
MARLVRCPKCQKLLVEYPNVSVYQCGGCGIALCTKDHQVASTEANLIAEPSQINQPESHSDRGFSNSESISGPLTSSNKEQQVDSVEVAGRVEDESVKLTGSSLVYYDGNVSSSDEARSVRTLGKSRRTVRVASNTDLKLHSGSVRSTSTLPDRASSSKGSSFDSDEFHSAAELLALPKGSFSGEMNEKVAILREIDRVREQLVRICVPSEGKQGQASRGTIHRWQRKQMHHCRPVSGAAPFVICAHCNKLLQLPAEDFLAPRRRSCKLKCTGCDAVLDLAFPAKVQSFTEVDLLHEDDENDRGYAKMESTGKRGSSSAYHGDFRPGIPRPPVMDEQV